MWNSLFVVTVFLEVYCLHWAVYIVADLGLVAWTFHEEGEGVIEMQYMKTCTSAQAAPRQLTVRPQVHYEALQAAQQRQETPEFTARYAL